MSGRWPILCDGAELAVECAHAASELGVRAEPRVTADPCEAAIDLAARGEPVALALTESPTPATLVALSGAALARGRTLPIALVAPEADRRRALARDLGLAAVAEVRPLLSILALQDAGAQRPWTATARQLPRIDRTRLAAALISPERGGGRLTREDEGRIGFATGDGPAKAVGQARDVAEALAALREASTAARPPMPSVEGVDPQSVRDVVFGPARALSDPASKAALAPYDVPLPVEELCTSPSRAASEATRIGFPVRIALASPDLRIWDHPELAADGIDNAARVRDVFRQITALANARAPDARLLGVTVSATTPARALLRVRVTPLPDELALAEIGFADPHGLASDDRTHTVLPAPPARLEAALGRLHGSPLLLEGSERRETLGEIGDVLLRVAAFVHEWRNELESVEIDPLALLVGGGLEVREACVTVSDAFERSLDAPARPG